MQSVQNLGLACISLLTGVIVDSAGYFVLEVFFLGCLCRKFLSPNKRRLFSLKYNFILNLFKLLF